ncbi:hypothetical protein Tco_1033435 [Tanacetum coccineum]
MEQFTRSFCNVCGNNAKANGSASRQAQQVKPIVGQHGSGGAGVGVRSQGSSHTRLTKRRVQIEIISPYKTSPTQPVSQPSTNSQVLVTETRNADGREIGDGISTQSSATCASDKGKSMMHVDEDMSFKKISPLAKEIMGLGGGGGCLREYVRVVAGMDDGGIEVMKYKVSHEHVCEEEVPLNNNIRKQSSDLVEMPSEAVEQGMDDNVSDEIDGAKGEQVSNHVGKKGNLEFLVCKQVANHGGDELEDKGRPLKRKKVYDE